MMDTVWRILIVALIAAIFVAVLKKTSPDMALLLTLTVCAVILFLLTEFSEKILTAFRQTFAAVGIEEELFLPLLKIVAVAVITKTGADICRDSGESAIGNLIESAGAFAAILLALPLFSVGWNLIQELL